MSEFFSSDLGKACLIFWGVLGFLLIWYVHKIKEVNQRDLDHPISPEEETNTEHSPFERLPENEELNYAKEDDLNSLEQSPIQKERGGIQ